MDNSPQLSDRLEQQPEALIDSEEFSTRLIELCLNNRLSRLPRKQRDQHILFKSVLNTLENETEYSEREINYRLQIWMTDIGRSLRTDHVHLRRWLVDAKFLERDRHGSFYRIANSGPAVEMFEPEVEKVDVYKTIGIGMKVAQEKKQEYMRRLSQG